ncbi:hypothetical protein CCMA1212_006086, partial [Trichoderma ghanense]
KGGRFFHRVPWLPGGKADKPFNWQRQAARDDGGQLFIECFPGARPCPAITLNPSAVWFGRHVLLGHSDSFERESILPPWALVHCRENPSGPVDWTGDDCLAWTERRYNSRRVAFVG